MTRSRATRWASVAGVLLALLLGSPSLATTAAPAPAPALTTAPTGYLPVGSWQLLAEVNKHRRAKRLPALRADAGLSSTARAWSERMAATGRLAHNESLFTTVSKQRLGLRLVGENVGYNFSVLAQHKAFLLSAGHRRNIESSRYNVAGFAVVRDKRGHLWSTQVFGTQR